MHKSVLLHQAIESLEPALKGEARLASRSDSESRRVFLDGTFGGGGHSREVRRRFGEKVRIAAIDRDPEVAEANPDFEVKTLSFADADKLGIRPDAILLDLGISSIQLETSGRGFSFKSDEPLDMRMSKSGITAAEVLNSWDEQAIELILRGFGEEKYSRRIAKEIVRRREMKAFETTSELVEAVNASVPLYYRRGRINPATRTFQALRIAVNEELSILEKGLENCFEILNPGGRMAVISFHSLEDRAVKNFFRDRAKGGLAKLVTKKPVVPSEEEITDNPRSRSAKLRVIEKI